MHSVVAGAGRLGGSRRRNPQRPRAWSDLRRITNPAPRPPAYVRPPEVKSEDIAGGSPPAAQPPREAESPEITRAE